MHAPLPGASPAANHGQGISHWHALASLPEHLSESFAPLSAEERVARIVEMFPKISIAMTSGGIQSRVLPTIFSNLRAAVQGQLALPALQRFPFVFIDTGDHFPETLQYIRNTER